VVHEEAVATPKWGVPTLALRCRELAERATTSQATAVLTYLAERWQEAADEREQAVAR
jgi:hypothetical protein